MRLITSGAKLETFVSEVALPQKSALAVGSYHTVTLGCRPGPVARWHYAGSWKKCLSVEHVAREESWRGLLKRDTSSEFTCILPGASCRGKAERWEEMLFRLVEGGRCCSHEALYFLVVYEGDMYTIRECNVSSNIEPGLN